MTDFPGWYYFGCIGSVGHYLFTAEGRSPSIDSGLRERLRRFDGQLPPPRKDGMFLASVNRFSGFGRNGYCALAWWDDSVDKRPGSNSVVWCPHMRTSAGAILAALPNIMPWLWKRHPVALHPDAIDLAASIPGAG